MPDNSLPKPVPPAQASDSTNKAKQKGADKMPPSARVSADKATQSKQPVQPKQVQSPNQPRQAQQNQPQQNKSQTKPAQIPAQPKKTESTQAQTQPKNNLSGQSLAESPQLSSEAKKSAKGKNQARGQATKKQPRLASVKKSPLRYLPYAIGVLILIGVGFFVWKRFLGNKPSSASVADQTETTQKQQVERKTVPAEQTELTYWGLWEPSNVLQEVLADFEADHEVKVEYLKQSHEDYRERLQSAVSVGEGPDIFRFHASWTPMLSAELAVLPQSVMTASEFKQTFYPSATKLLSYKGQLRGIPLMYDGLGLYYNKKMLDAADAEPPKTWAEVKTLANQLTVKEGGKVKRGGLAIGNASNVEHFSDILALLMLQNGADLTNPVSQQARDALVFYTNFMKQDQVWSDKLPSSTLAFARGEVAMMFAPSWRAHEVMEVNPDLEFGITTVPQLGDKRISWARFWVEGVNRKSKQQEEAWQLLKYLSSKEVQKKLYSAQSEIRAFGEPYSRQDLAGQLADNELVAPFLEDAPSAQGWYVASYTHDNGLNDLLIKHYRDAINSMLSSGTDAEEALQVVGQGTRQVLRQYGVE